MTKIPPKLAGQPPVNSPLSSTPSPWRSRGYLPHFHQPRLVQSLTFRLHDAVPEPVVQSWKAELGWRTNLPATDPREVELRKLISQYEDAGHGACWPLAEIVHSWKSYTAHAANQILKRSGDFWFREYFDRFVRDDRHFANAVRYIEQNPVKAGLVRTPEDWRWSSSWRLQDGEEEGPRGKKERE